MKNRRRRVGGKGEILTPFSASDRFIEEQEVKTCGMG
jgi:hypothetical protein